MALIRCTLPAVVLDPFTLSPACSLRVRGYSSPLLTFSITSSPHPRASSARSFIHFYLPSFVWNTAARARKSPLLRKRVNPAGGIAP